MNKITIFYIPTPSIQKSEEIGNQLVVKKLAACTNIIAEIGSIYFFAGAITNESESLLIAKTLPEYSSLCAQKIRELHPYECPAIISIEANANEDYISWMKNYLKS